MNAKPIIFRKGEENGIVVERDHFENSIMLNQYQQAIDIFNRLWAQQYKQIEKLEKNDGIENDIWIDNKTSNIIAFCGDRGEGKSSCMASFATMLTDKDVQKEAKKVLAFPKDENNNDIMLSPDKIEWLDVLDPSFFDDQHNLLELLLGRVSQKAQEKIKRECEKDCSKICSHRELMEQLQRVRKCISVMAPKKGDATVYDTVEEMSDLAAGMQLKTELQTLFKCYLQYVGKDCLLICIDDLDLNISEGYKMAEMLRKYLINPYCIVLVSVKTEQLIDVIATAHKKAVKDSGIAWKQCQLMAQKYVAKLLPREQRIAMPNSIDICEREIQIAERNEDAKLEAITVKERVVQLIFQKTGYVFYNSQSISPIIPRNLRSLRHLLGTLEVLPDARRENWDDDDTGREVFQDYFFGTWVTTNLVNDDIEFAHRLAMYDNLTTLNAYVVEYFAQRIKKAGIEVSEQTKTDGKKQPKTRKLDELDAETYNGDYIPLYIQITNRVNTSANISVGDVMYIMWLISTITVDSGIQNLIFFIKTIYSMRLYACYNEVTKEQDRTLFPQAGQNQSYINIHKADSLYDRVNYVQRLVNGSYFSYPSGSLLSNKRDRIEINFNKVKELYALLKNEHQKNNTDSGQEYIQLVTMCEFIALCITHASTKENIEKKNFAREAKTPTFLGTFSHTASSAIFDFLNPFYALTNIKYAYHRFDEILADNPKNYNDNDEAQQNKLYTIAEECNASLLSQMKGIRQGEYKDNWDMHGLVSDAIIRVTDIQWAIFEELLRQYRTHRVGSLAEKIFYAYGDIQNLQITLFPKLTITGDKVIENHSAHAISFDFLGILRQFLVSTTNRDMLEKLLIANESDNLKTDLEKFTENIAEEFTHVSTWPLSGLEIKTMLKDISKLKGGKKSSFSARLGQIFDSNEHYTIDQVLGKGPEISNAYLIANAR